MSRLRKDKITEVTPGTAGQQYVPATPAKSGHWTTTEVAKVGCRPYPVEGSVPGSWRMASYEEIRKYLANGSQDKCFVLKKQMEACWNTEWLFTSIAYINHELALAVAPRPGTINDIAVCVINKFSSDYTKRENPAKQPTWWSFEENYTCTIDSNGVEQITRI